MPCPLRSSTNSPKILTICTAHSANSPSLPVSTHPESYKSTSTSSPPATELPQTMFSSPSSSAIRAEPAHRSQYLYARNSPYTTPTKRSSKDRFLAARKEGSTWAIDHGWDPEGVNVKTLDTPSPKRYLLQHQQAARDAKVSLIERESKRDLCLRVFQDAFAAGCGYKTFIQQSSDEKERAADKRLEAGSTGRNRRESVMSKAALLYKEANMTSDEIKIIAPLFREQNLNDSAHEMSVYQVAWGLDLLLRDLKNSDEYDKDFQCAAIEKAFKWFVKFTIEDILSKDPLPRFFLSASRGLYKKASVGTRLRAAAYKEKDAKVDKPSKDTGSGNKNFNESSQQSQNVGEAAIPENTLKAAREGDTNSMHVKRKKLVGYSSESEESAPQRTKVKLGT